MKIVIAILALFCVLLLYHVWNMKKQMRQMREELKNTRDKDYNRYITLQLMDKDLSDLAAEMNQNLEYQQQLKMETEKSELQLRQSISDIAHDLRTPITVIKGNLQMLKSREDLQDKEKEYLSICSEKTDTLKSMVDEFFELSYLESEDTEVLLKKTDMTEFLAHFILGHEAIILEKGLEPKIELPEKSIFAKVDDQLMTRMLENLFNNILKHASGNFGIALREINLKDSQQTTKRNGGGVSGINPEEAKTSCVQIDFSNLVSADENFDLAHLFDRTYRGNKARTGGGPGGLGLYIVKILAEKQNATATAKLQGRELHVYINIPI